MSISQIPYYDFSHRSPLHEEFTRRQATILEHERMVGGRYTAFLERQLAYRLGFEHAVVCSSGTMALNAIGRYLKLKRGLKRVHIPEFTFQSVFGAFTHSDLKLTKVPVNENYLATNFQCNGKTEAAVVTGILGQNNFEIPEAGHLIFDASQNWQGLHTNANHPRYKEAFVAISFDPAKSIGGFMDGGMILTNDDHAYDFFRHLTRMESSNSLIEDGIFSLNARMSEIGAMYLELQLPRLDTWLNKRRDHAKAMDEVFQGYHLKRDYTTDEVQKYVLPTKDVNRAKEIALKWGIETKVLYSHATPALALPMYPNLSIREYCWRLAEYRDALLMEGVL